MQRQAILECGLDVQPRCGELAAGHSTGGRLTGEYAQYQVAGKHWYAPNLFEAYGEPEIAAVVVADPESKVQRFRSPAPLAFASLASLAQLTDRLR